jgi:hypothetical protein
MPILHFHSAITTGIMFGACTKQAQWRWGNEGQILAS